MVGRVTFLEGVGWHEANQISNAAVLNRAVPEVNHEPPSSCTEFQTGVPERSSNIIFRCGA